MSTDDGIPEPDFWQANKTRQCPYCSNIIPAAEDPCHYCGHLEPADGTTLQEINRKQARSKLVDILLDFIYRMGQ